jgi:hypothetical protein
LPKKGGGHRGPGANFVGDQTAREAGCHWFPYTKDLHFINNKITGEIVKRNMNEKIKFELLLKKKQ